MSERKFVSISFTTNPKTNRILTNDEITYKEVRVPPRYQSDGMTKLVNKYKPRHLRAAVVHDYICETKCLPRKVGDQYFYEILRLDGASRFMARAFWLFVRGYAIATFKK